MQLKEWRESKGLSQEEVGRLISENIPNPATKKDPYSRSTVSKYESGDVMPSLEVCSAIETVTDGAVLMEDFINVLQGPDN